ncbi:MAG: hypothetical protein L0Z62_32500 [Gemmataceae bacterium]|nr:hypothetical protein [Gemmataceae bacterium]
MSLPHDLLKLARELVDRNPTAPVAADLRRGVSTAYYALFHLLIEEATNHLVAIVSLRARVARSFDHKVMKVVCQDYVKLIPNAAGELVTAAGEVVPKGIQDIASGFVALQQARYQADYDTAVVITQAQADIDVRKAEAAFTEWGTVHADPAAATFLAELLCRGIPKR